MDAYSVASWGPAFTATAGAAAALAGLLFVALSINLKQIIASRLLVNRAIEVLVLLAAALLLSTLLLMPGMPANGVAIEIIAVAIGTAAVTGFIQVRSDRRAAGLTATQFGSRVFGDQVGPLFLVVGGVSLLFQNGGGLYWVVPAILAMIIAALVGAWVLLVEILR